MNKIKIFWYTLHKNYRRLRKSSVVTAVSVIAVSSLFRIEGFIDSLIKEANKTKCSVPAWIIKALRMENILSLSRTYDFFIHMH